MDIRFVAQYSRHHDWIIGMALGQRLKFVVIRLRDHLQVVDPSHRALGRLYPVKAPLLAQNLQPLPVLQVGNPVGYGRQSLAQKRLPRRNIDVLPFRMGRKSSTAHEAQPEDERHEHTQKTETKAEKTCENRHDPQYLSINSETCMSTPLRNFASYRVNARGIELLGCDHRNRAGRT